MVKKFICPICGYVHEGTEAPERCPQCKQIVTWKVAESDKLNFACEHVLGVAKDGLSGDCCCFPSVRLRRGRALR